MIFFAHNRYTDGDFHHLKTLRVDHPDRPGRVVKQRSVGMDRLQVTPSREQRHDAFRRRSVSDEPRSHPLDAADAEQGPSRAPGDEDLFPVTSAPLLAQQFEEDDDDDDVSLGYNNSYQQQRTEVSVEVHREPSNGSSSISSRSELASGSRTASPPKLLETASRASSRTRHSISLETVSPTERLAVSLEKRRVRSCESELHDYDRLEITQFHRGPFYNADYDVMSEGGSPELRSKVRYNDTGSFEEVNEEHMHILDVVSSIEDVTMEDDDDTETLNGAQKYRELWNLRATFEEEEDFSDTIRMEDLTSPDEQSPEEQEQATTSELTTSFESNTDPVAEQDEGHDQAEGECEGNHCPPPCQRRKSSSTLLIPQLSYESKRQNYRGILTRRGKKIEMPKATNDNSFDSIETDGEVSEDTSRHEVTTTSFESNTDNTDSTSEAQNPRKLQEMRGDSGYKSLETQQTLQGSLMDPQQQQQQQQQQQVVSTSATYTPPLPLPQPQPQPSHTPTKPVRKQIQFTIETEDTHSGDSKDDFNGLIDTVNKPCATSPTAEGGLQRSPSQKKTLFERRTAKTASKKRREYGREKQVQYVYESVGVNMEAETDSKSDQQSGDSFEDNALQGSGGKFSVFSRFFRSQKKKAMHRDFSIDEKTDALFQKFTRYDPRLERPGLGGPSPAAPQTLTVATVRRQSYPTRPARMHRRPTDPGPGASVSSTGGVISINPRRPRDQLNLEVRSVSMESDSTCSTDPRLSLAQDSIEEEEMLPLADDAPRDTSGGGGGGVDLQEQALPTPPHHPPPPLSNSSRAPSRKESILQDIPIIKLPEGEPADLC